MLKMKKTITILLSIALLLSLSISAVATEAYASDIEIAQYGGEEFWHEITLDFTGGTGHWALSVSQGSAVHSVPHDYFLVSSSEFLPIITIRLGYVFLGWSLTLDGSEPVCFNSGWLVEGPRTFYAVWEPNGILHEVAFDLNGGFDVHFGIGPVVHSIPDGYRLDYGSEFLPSPLRDGYYFQGWYCEQGWRLHASWGTLILRAQTFYAMWKACPNRPHEITFNFNGGFMYNVGYGPMVHSVPHNYWLTYGSEFTPFPHRDGYNFAGWYCEEDGMQLRYTWTVDRPRTFYARWQGGMDPEPEWHQIIFDPNGGLTHVGHEPMIHSVPDGYWLHYGSEIVPDPYRAGYNFVGWYPEEGTPLRYGWTVDRSLIFYARWQLIGNTPSDINLALNTQGAVMSASSAQGVRTADRANNGIREGAVTNSWSAAGVNQEWLMVDFGEQRNFNTVWIFQGGSRIMDYRFEHSNDGVNWTVFHSSPNRMLPATPAVYEVTTSATTQARFIRLVSERSSGAAIVVFEFEVFYMI